MEFVKTLYTWLADNPETVLQVVFVLWAAANVVWAQWPKPKTDRAEQIWKWVHFVMGLITTHATAKGTFTWPQLLKPILDKVVETPDPFEPKEPK